METPLKVVCNGTSQLAAQLNTSCLYDQVVIMLSFAKEGMTRGLCRSRFETKSTMHELRMCVVGLV